MNYYKEFLKSEWWKHIRSIKIKQGKKCFICGSYYNLQVHHIGYDNLFKGKTNEAIKNTKVLCGDCHNAVTKEYKDRKLYSKDSDKVILEFKNEYIKFRKKLNKDEEVFSEICKNF
jgi:5-methylcytosine-specific restriction endonuclease McrA